MSGHPHGLASPGNEIKPVLHIISWCKDGVATVRWCGGKYLFEAALVLEAGETKPCPMCGKELHHDRKTKGVVEGGFPKVPNRIGGQMKVREALEDVSAEQGHPLIKFLAPIIEKFGRAAYWEGVNDARYADLHPNDKYITLDGQEGIDAGLAAMVEKPDE